MCVLHVFSSEHKVRRGQCINSKQNSVVTTASGPGPDWEWILVMGRRATLFQKEWSSLLTQ